MPSERAWDVVRSLPWPRTELEIAEAIDKALRAAREEGFREGRYAAAKAALTWENTFIFQKIRALRPEPESTRNLDTKVASEGAGEASHE